MTRATGRCGAISRSSSGWTCSRFGWRLRDRASFPEGRRPDCLLPGRQGRSHGGGAATLKQRGNDGRRYWRECHNKGGYWRDLLVAVLHRPVRSGQASLVGGRTLVTGRDIAQAVENA